jgi:hypothetical protein
MQINTTIKTIRIIVIIILLMPNYVLKLLGYNKRILFLLNISANVYIGIIIIYYKLHWQNINSRIRERYFRF